MNRRIVFTVLGVTTIGVAIVLALWQRPPQVAFPMKPGSYSAEGWRYDYSIAAAGKRSERRTGRLTQDGNEVTGALGEIRETPLGRFAYFGGESKNYNIGWLNTMTYDRPVFGRDSNVLPELKGYFNDVEPAETIAL